MRNVRSGRRSPEYQRAAVAYSARLRHMMRLRGMTRSELAVAVGVSGPTVSNWARAYYIPRPDLGTRVAEILDDARLAELAANGRKIRCAVCGRTTWRGVTRRRYCSYECWSKGASRVESSAAQAAIDAFCFGCEPEGLCRTPECALQPFSPLPLVELHRFGAA